MIARHWACFPALNCFSRAHFYATSTFPLINVTKLGKPFISPKAHAYYMCDLVRRIRSRLPSASVSLEFLVPVLCTPAKTPRPLPLHLCTAHWSPLLHLRLDTRPATTCRLVIATTTLSPPPPPRLCVTVSCCFLSPLFASFSHHCCTSGQSRLSNQATRRLEKSFRESFIVVVGEKPSLVRGLLVCS